MYQSMLPILKPLVFEGKSGVLQVTHKYDDQAKLFLREGIIEQIETKNLKGQQAAITCARWVNISVEFKEGVQESYTNDPKVDTNSFLSYLEKTSKTIKVITKRIPDDDTIFRINSKKLNRADKLHVDDFKIALLFDGKRSIEQILAMAGKSELAVLSHTCRLIFSGVAELVIQKDVMEKEDRIDFLKLLHEKLTELVGPAGSILVDDAFESIDSDPAMLTKKEIPLLIVEIGTLLDDEDQVELDAWGIAHL
jgi:hypothetical protein